MFPWVLGLLQWTVIKAAVNLHSNFPEQLIHAMRSHIHLPMHHVIPVADVNPSCNSIDHVICPFFRLNRTRFFPTKSHLFEAVRQIGPPHTLLSPSIHSGFLDTKFAHPWEAPGERHYLSDIIFSRVVSREVYDAVWSHHHDLPRLYGSQPSAPSLPQPLVEIYEGGHRSKLQARRRYWYKQLKANWYNPVYWIEYVYHFSAHLSDRMASFVYDASRYEEYRMSSEREQSPLQLLQKVNVQLAKYDLGNTNDNFVVGSQLQYDPYKPRQRPPSLPSRPLPRSPRPDANKIERQTVDLRSLPSQWSELPEYYGSTFQPRSGHDPLPVGRLIRWLGNYPVRHHAERSFVLLDSTRSHILLNYPSVVSNISLSYFPPEKFCPLSHSEVSDPGQNEELDLSSHDDALWIRSYLKKAAPVHQKDIVQIRLVMTAFYFSDQPPLNGVRHQTWFRSESIKSNAQTRRRQVFSVSVPLFDASWFSNSSSCAELEAYHRLNPVEFGALDFAQASPYRRVNGLTFRLEVTLKGTNADNVDLSEVDLGRLVLNGFDLHRYDFTDQLDSHDASLSSAGPSASQLGYLSKRTVVTQFGLKSLEALYGPQSPRPRVEPSEMKFPEQAWDLLKASKRQLDAKPELKYIGTNEGLILMNDILPERKTLEINVYEILPAESPLYTLEDLYTHHLQYFESMYSFEDILTSGVDKWDELTHMSEYTKKGDGSRKSSMIFHSVRGNGPMMQGTFNVTEVAGGLKFELVLDDNQEPQALQEYIYTILDDLAQTPRHLDNFGEEDATLHVVIDDSGGLEEALVSTLMELQ